MATYYSIRIPKVWIIVLNISNSGAILVKNSYNSIIDKIKVMEKAIKLEEETFAELKNRYPFLSKKKIITNR